MEDLENSIAAAIRRAPWNKGKLTRAKPPLRPKHVRSIRTKLQIEGNTRDLAVFNLAIDSKLRGCDVVALKVGRSSNRATKEDRTAGQIRIDGADPPSR